MSESPNPIYDQTTKAQGFDPLNERWGGGIISGSVKIHHTTINRELLEKLVEGGQISNDPAVYEVPEEIAANIQRGNIGGYSIRKGGKANGKGRRR